MQSLMTCGIFWSTDSTSFENRDRMRPTGVVSNMVIGDFITFSRSIECRTLAACKLPSAGARSEKNDVTPAIRQFSMDGELNFTSIGKTIGQPAEFYARKVCSSRIFE